MKTLNIFLLLALLCSSVSVPASAGSEGGNGGGGIQRQGMYLTFGSAHVKLEPTPVTDIPGLNLAKSAIAKLSLNEPYRGQLYSAILPIGGRKYFNISSRDLTSEKKSALISAYVKALNGQVSEDELVIYAITSPADKTTYLLPEFYKLTKSEEPAAILFHEAEWILNSKLSYNDVIDGEMNFQAYIENLKGNTGYDTQLFGSLGKLFSDWCLSVQAALWDDFQAGRLKWAMSDNNTRFISLQKLLNGKARLSGSTQKASPYRSLFYSLDSDVLTLGLVDAMTQHPDVKVLSQLYNLIPFSLGVYVDVPYKGFWDKFKTLGVFITDPQDTSDNKVNLADSSNSDPSNPVFLMLMASPFNSMNTEKK